MTLCKPSALFFDLDGTLVDSIADLTVSANHTRAHYDLPPIGEDVVRSYVGDGARKLLARSIGLRDEEVDEALRIFREHYIENCLVHTRPYPGVMETLQCMADLPMAIVSNKPQEMTSIIASGLGLDRWLTVVIGARRKMPVKPAPDLLILAADELGADLRGSWMIGDSVNDVRVGQAVGAGTVGLSYGIGDPAAIAAAQPDAMLDSFAGLLDLRRAR